MLGLGEKEDEIRKALKDLADIKLNVLTLGQYLQPSPEYAPIDRWATPEEFANWKTEALGLGIQVVESGPLVRSSYHAEEQSARFASEKRISA
jgi:lipoic acid synthetase